MTPESRGRNVSGRVILIASGYTCRNVLVKSFHTLCRLGGSVQRGTYCHLTTVAVTRVLPPPHGFEFAVLLEVISRKARHEQSRRVISR